MKTINLSLTLLITLITFPATATEYIYRDLMANTLLSAKCETSDAAIKTASKPYKLKLYSKKFCQTQGYGWHVAEIKDTGQVSCRSCGNENSQQKCYLQDVIVKCKRIKPGSVGMLPGKG